MNKLRPYEPLIGMSTKIWLTIPTANVEISLLVPCQNHLTDTWKPGNSFCGDPFPHVVFYEGIYFISDGHNRIAYQKKLGRTFVEARVIYKIKDQILIPLSMTG